MDMLVYLNLDEGTATLVESSDEKVEKVGLRSMAVSQSIDSVMSLELELIVLRN